MALETENLVPSNNNPDPASDIYIIGKSVGKATNGTVTFPDIPDPDEYWDIPNECQNETEFDDIYWVCFVCKASIPFISLIHFLYSHPEKNL